MWSRVGRGGILSVSLVATPTWFGVMAQTCTLAEFQSARLDEGPGEPREENNLLDSGLKKPRATGKRFQGHRD